MLKRVVCINLCLCLCVMAPFSSFSKVSPRTYLRKVINIIEKGNYHLGSKELYRLSRLKAYRGKRVQILYTLGIAFLELKLYHMASLQFINIIKKHRGTYKRKSLEKLSLILRYFEDDQLFCSLNSHIKPGEYPMSVKDSLHFYFGKCAMHQKKFNLAHRHFSKVRSGFPSYSKVLYYRGLAYAEQNKVKSSLSVFRNLASTRTGITDTNRVVAMMSLARVLYQGKHFKESIRIYRTIPKDTKYFHDALMENSWNYLRSGKFRSALSNFQSLHSVFYKNYYQPESFILRAYVYLYICKYYEMEKVLDFFNGVYLPILKNVTKSLRWGNNYKSYLTAVLDSRRNKGRGFDFSDGGSFPEVVLDRVEKNIKFQSLANYLEKLKQEKAVLESFPSSWKRNKVGKHARLILNKRIVATQKAAGREVRNTLLEVRRDLKKLSNFEQFLRYDMLKGKREFLKKKIARKYLDKIQIDERISRNYYVQNGYEYWPFKGEAWLDELGNYHYLGKQSCE